jgi:hypothetical protein
MMLMGETTVTTTHWHGVDPAFALEFSQRLIAACTPTSPISCSSRWPTTSSTTTPAGQPRCTGTPRPRGFADLRLELVEGALVDPAAP